MTERIILIGTRGMLGQMADYYFRQAGYEVISINDRLDFNRDCPGVRALHDAGPGLVINTLGRIKQKSPDLNDLMLSNAVLPLQIYEGLAPGQFLVQPSTDCVFEGTAPMPYLRDAKADASDLYGWSKRLGEVALVGKSAACVVRVSIIGPDSNDPAPKGLLGWFLSQPHGARLSGFTNHWWNGITTLEWCRQIEARLIRVDRSAYAGHLIQIGTPTACSKFELLRYFQQEFGTDYQISPVRHPDDIFRVLKSDYVLADIRDQLADLNLVMKRSAG